MRNNSLSKTLGIGHVLSTPLPTYTFISSPTSVNEGNTITFLISATGLPIGSSIGWQIILSGNLTNSDFSGYVGSSLIIDNVATIPVTTVADFLTEGAETFQLLVYSDYTRSTLVLTSSTVTINDTSVPTYTFTSAPTSLNEGVGGNFTIATQGTGDGVSLFWTINHITTAAADFSAVSGSFTINSNSGSFSITTIADVSLEGPQTFTVSIRTISTSGTIVATSASITINDTSVPAFNAFSATPNSPAFLTTPITVSYTLGSETSATMNIGSALTNANVTSPMQVVPYLAYSMGYASWCVDRFVTGTNDGTNGTSLSTSTNGITWTTVGNTPSSMSWVTKSSSIWVAVGVAGACYRSTDGTNWTAQTTNAYPYDLYSVVWTGSAFVAAGAWAIIVTSTDGITWTVRQAGGTTNHIGVLEYNNGVLVAGGYVNATGAAFIQTSTATGATWTTRSSSVTGSATRFAWTGSIWMGVIGGVVATGGAAGASWSAATMPTGGQGVVDGIASSGAGTVVLSTSKNELYITTTPATPVWIKVLEAGSEGGTLSFGNSTFIYAKTGIYTSSDGYTWVQRAAATSVAWILNTAGNIFYGCTGNRIYTSSNGINWSDGTKISPWNFASYAAAIGNTVIVIGGHNRDTVYGSQWVGIGMMVSSDAGVTWVEKLPQKAYGPPNIQLTPYGITTSPSRFVIWGQNGIWTSSGTDASSWFQSASFTGTVRSCVWTGTKFMAKGDQTDGWTSTDGTTWTTVTTTALNITAGVWTGSAWFGSAWFGRICKSTDGATWTTIQTSSSNDLYSIAYISSINTLVAVGFAGTIVSSTDGGTTWVVRSSPTTQNITKVVANSTIFCATYGLDGNVITSTDGITWKISRFALNMAKYNTTSSFSINLTGSPAGAGVSQGVTVQGMNASALQSAYTITPTVGSMNEGTINTWTVTQTNLGVGTALYWTNSGTSVAADFTDSLQQGSIIMSYRSPLEIERSVLADVTSEGSETIVLNLRTGSPSGTIVQTSPSVTITDTSKGTGTATPNYTYIHQGETVIYTINTSGIPTGTTLYWTTSAPSGVLFTDADTFSTGSYTVTAGTPYTITRYTRMNNVGGYATGQAMFMYFYFDLAHTDLSFSSSVCYVVTNLLTLDVTSTIDETTTTTTTFTFRIYASGGASASDVRGTQYWIPNYMTFYWEILGNNYATPISAADFSNTTLTGSVLVNGAIVSSLYRQATWTKVAVADQLTEGTESYNAIIRSESAAGPIIATSNTGVINDTSLTPGAAFNSTPGSFQEGTAGTFSVLAINYSGTYYWTINHITTNASDFTATSGSFAVSAGSGTFSITPTADATTEGSETFTVSIRFGSTSGNVMATSTTQTIADTSYTPSYSFSSAPTSINEGVTTNYTVSTSGVNSGTTLYWTINHITTAAADFSAVSGSFTVTGTYASSSGTVGVVTTADLTTEGAQTFSLQVRTGSTAGTVVLTSATITINDTSTTPPGQLVHATAGSTTWVCPAGVTSVSVVCIGAGGGGAGFNGSTNNFGAGGGGAVVYRNNIAVTPGTTYYLYVPQTATGFTGGNPYYGANNVANAGDGSFAMFGTGFTSATALCYAPGGHGGRTFNVDSAPYTGTYQGGLGGGATGLSDFSLGTLGAGGQGGNGGSTGFGAGGGGAGGYSAVGGQGQGSNGAAGTRGGAYTTTTGAAGAVGTGMSLLGTTPGGGTLYGGGGGGGWVASGTRGANGAVRIMWPGTTRAYPATGVADQ